MSVDYTVAGEVATITLARPAAMNAIDGETTAQLRAAVDRFEADAEARVAILTGEGRAFCAGMDLKAFAAGEGPAVLEGPGHFGGFVARERSKPVIAAVNGPALAGGLELVLACDLAIASSAATFGVPEVLRGIFAGAGAAIRLPRRIPRVHAMRLLLTGEIIDATRALRIGLVDEVVDPDKLFSSALAIASAICRAAPLSVAATLRLGRLASDRDEAELWEANAREWGAIVGSADAAEGPLAFAEKRPAVWTGR